ncbi:hypothetical protein R3I94_001301 [Phoxinus phoxinus]
MQKSCGQFVNEVN